MFTARKGNQFALFFVIHFLAGNLLLALLLRNMPLTGSMIPSIAASQILLVFMPSVYYNFFFKTPAQSTFRFYKTNPLNLLLSTLLAITSIPLVMLVNLISQFLFTPALEDTLSNIGNESYLLSILTIAVFPGIFEELISRGIILSHYKHKSLVVTSTISGLFFGMMHMNMNQFMYAFVLGFLFSVVVHITGSIVTSIIMHFLINSINLSLAYLATSELFTSMPGYEEQQAMVDTMNRSELLLQSLGIVILLFVLSLPFFLGILFALIMVNEKMDLIKSNAISYKFFEGETETEEAELEALYSAAQATYDSYRDDNDDETPTGSESHEIESLNTYDDAVRDSIDVARSKNQRVFTVAMVLTIVIFVLVAGITELLPGM